MNYHIIKRENIMGWREYLRDNSWINFMFFFEIPEDLPADDVEWINSILSGRYEFWNYCAFPTESNYPLLFLESDDDLMLLKLRF
jgi:hypothetical protein